MNKNIDPTSFFPGTNSILIQAYVENTHDGLQALMDYSCLPNEIAIMWEASEPSHQVNLLQSFQGAVQVLQAKNYKILEQLAHNLLGTLQSPCYQPTNNTPYPTGEFKAWWNGVSSSVLSLGYTYRGIGKYFQNKPDGLADLKTAINLHPKNPLACASLGLAKLSRGEWGAANAYFSSVLLHAPKSSYLYLQAVKAMILQSLHQGDTVGASQTITQAPCTHADDDVLFSYQCLIWFLQKRTNSLQTLIEWGAGDANSLVVHYGKALHHMLTDNRAALLMLRNNAPQATASEWSAVHLSYLIDPMIDSYCKGQYLDDKVVTQWIKRMPPGSTFPAMLQQAFNQCLAGS